MASRRPPAVGATPTLALLSQFAIEIGGGLLVGALLLFAFLRFAFTIEEDPPEAIGEATGGAEVDRALEAEPSIKASVLSLALALRSAHTAGRRKDLHHPLNALALIYEGMLDSGPQGMLDMTEYCNAVGAHPPKTGLGPA